MLPERDCLTCDAVRKRIWGCYGDAEQPVLIGGEEYTTCPRRPILDYPDRFGYWMRMYKYYRRGHLPEPGSVSEQSAVTLRVFDILDRVYADIEEFRSKENERKARGQGGGETRRGGALQG